MSVGVRFGDKSVKTIILLELNKKTGFLSEFQFTKYFIDVSHPNSICLNLTARQSFMQI